jgi:hypothetical protein
LRKIIGSFGGKESDKDKADNEKKNRKKDHQEDRFSFVALFEASESLIRHCEIKDKKLKREEKIIFLVV